MKKRTKRLCSMLTTAVLLAAESTAMSASALYCWGTAPGEAFENMQVLDDKGIFQWVPKGMGWGANRPYQVVVNHYSTDVEVTWTDGDTGEVYEEIRHNEGDSLYVVMPRVQAVEFRLREGVDQEIAEGEVFAVLQKYYPNIQNVIGVSHKTWSDEPIDEVYFDKWLNGYRVVDLSETQGSEEIAEGIMRDLAAAGLISDFYSWGQTADYQAVWYGYLTAYYPTHIVWEGNNYVTEEYDWAAVEAYLATAYPEYELVYVTAEDEEIWRELGYTEWESPMYLVIPNEELTFAEHFALAAELYEQCGIVHEFALPASAADAGLYGTNALAGVGDVDQDGAVKISDAIMLARYTAEDTTIAITDAGVAAADVNFDGKVNVADSTALLRKLAGLEPIRTTATYLDEFFELTLQEIEATSGDTSGAGYRPGIDLYMHGAQWNQLLDELAMQNSAIVGDSQLLLDAFCDLLLEKLHLKGIYDVVDPDCTELKFCLQNYWTDTDDPLYACRAADGDDIWISLSFGGWADNVITLTYQGEPVSITAYEATKRALYVIHTYGEQDYFMVAWQTTVDGDPDESTQQTAPEVLRFRGLCIYRLMIHTECRNPHQHTD